MQVGFKKVWFSSYYIGSIQWELKQIKPSAIEHPFFGVDEMVEWFMALNFRRSNRWCPRIESAECLFYL